MHLGLSSEYPTLKKLLEFLNDKARALEQIETRESNITQPTTRSSQPNIRSHAATMQVGKSQGNGMPSYPCDHCKGQHYIVTSPKFRELTPRQRLSVVRRLRLCFNCMGHHSVAACKTTKRCNQCGSNHHTMLHIADGNN